ncbi:hypothetical protein BH24ACI3_BH24ACI3_05930 [soil metagenome]
MEALNLALLVNWLGFSVGVALYLMLAVMVVRNRSGQGSGINFLLLATAGLGMIWNVGELVVILAGDLSTPVSFPFITAAAYSALGVLPSVVVHSVQNEAGGNRILTWTAYSISAFATVLHFYAAFSGGSVPSPTAFIALTAGAIFLTSALLILNFRQALDQKAVWVTALLIFAVSGLHFVTASEGNSWIMELAAHQSSIPLALAILYQNYRFAFADLFLKRAISVMLLALVAFALYVWVAAPLLRYHETHDRNDVQAIGLILILWMATALAYPSLHKLAIWLVDKVILHRADYGGFQIEVAKSIQEVETVGGVLDLVATRLSTVLTAGRADWNEKYEQLDTTSANIVRFVPDRADIFVPTSETPHYAIELDNFHGGRRLLSDETAMLEAVSLFTARRIDALRVSHERCELEIREQEFSKLAAEAQLTALRAQINPHFLFNALTTIGYLIQTTPDKAFQTLLQLTKLLRGVLTSTDEMCSLGDELRLIESYLDIERARFEERLEVTIDVPEKLMKLQIPALILQPLVENAIKHGISENRKGGVVAIKAKATGVGSLNHLKLTVSNTRERGSATQSGKKGGIGLNNIRDRLRSHYGHDASLELILSETGIATANLSIPVGEPMKFRRINAEILSR